MAELCSLPALYLGPDCGGGDEDDGDLLQRIPGMHCYTLGPRPCSRPPLTHASAGDSRTPTGKSGQSPVGSLLLSPGPGAQGSAVPSKSIFPRPV